MSALQKNLLVAFALFLMLQAGASLAEYFAALSPGTGFGGDFICFWDAARRVRQGDIAAIYDPGHWQTLLAAGHLQLRSWFVYPPFMLMFLWPLGHMTYGQAVSVWSLAPLLFFFGLLSRLAQRSRLEGFQPLLVLGALTLPFVMANLFTGQTGTFIAALFLGAALFWDERPILAGICIGLMAIKPQMGFVLPLALVAAGRWRTIAAAAATVLMLAAMATAWLGAAIWIDYLRMTGVFSRFISAGHAGIGQLALAPYVSLQSAGLPASLAAVVQAIISLAVVTATVRVFWQARRGHEDGRQDLRLALLAIATLLATPYALAYDTPMLALAIVPLFARTWRSGWDGLELVSVTALVMVPYVQPLLVDKHVPYGFLALLLSFVVIWLRYRQDPSARTALSHPGISLSSNVLGA